MPESFNIGKILRSWWTWGAALLAAVGYYVVWPVATEVIRHYPDYRVSIPMLLRDYHQWREAKAPSPPPAPKQAEAPPPIPKKAEAPAPAPKQAEAPAPPSPPPPKKAEAPKPSGLCIASASGMLGMLRAAGGQKHASHFDVFFKDKETCFVMKLTGTGTLRMEFATRTWLHTTPTFYVTPRDKADLERFKSGDWLRIRGRLVRYVDVAGSEPDEIYIEGATFTRVDADELETGSIRR